jgi:hypothetical protein
MNTTVADLGTGDKIDLSFLENKSLVDANSTANVSIDSSSLFANAGGVATMAAAGTTLNFGGNIVATSSEADKGSHLSNAEIASGVLNNDTVDVNTGVTAGTMLISNATLTQAAAAINAGHDSLSTIDFNTPFGHLTDTYNHHG